MVTNQLLSSRMVHVCGYSRKINTHGTCRESVVSGANKYIATRVCTYTCRVVQPRGRFVSFNTYAWKTGWAYVYSRFSHYLGNVLSRRWLERHQMNCVISPWTSNRFRSGQFTMSQSKAGNLYRLKKLWVRNLHPLVMQLYGLVVCE